MTQAQMDELTMLSAELKESQRNSWGKACSWCHRELDANNKPGRSITNEHYPMYADHGICTDCCRVNFSKGN